ncbi:MAG: translation initiation factor IF-2 [Bacteroidales bacterium]|nr:translation initiation factor IF-2 [Bacteroidales bacterium]
MPVRLQKVAKEVNVGVSTLAEFLRKKNIMVEDDPNTKVTDEAYELLWKEFGHGEMPKREEKPAPVVEKPKEEEPKIVEKEPVKEEVKAPVAEPERPRVKVLGKIDESVLSPSKSKEKAAPAPAKEEKPAEKPVVVKEQPEPQAKDEQAPVEEAPQAGPVEDQPAVSPDVEVREEPQQPVQSAPEPEEEAPADQTERPEEEQTDAKEPEIFSLSHKLTTNIKVVSTIDLDSINQYTRPKKKTKQEKQKEQEERRQREQAEKKQRVEAAKAARPGAGEAGDSVSEGEHGQGKKKRNRIRDGKIRIDSSADFSSGSYGSDRQRESAKGGKHGKKPLLKTEVSDEDVSRQIKETLARLSTKPKKGVKYRKEKREAVSQRQQEMEEREALESNIIKITEFVTVNDLASMMNVPVVQVISKCMEMGQMVSINQRLDAETINIVADEFGFTTEYVSAEVMQAIHEDEDKEEDLVPRPPIITVMGHVDHGKTSLLDYIRNANVIAGEAGGITQHIGAYSVTLDDGREITFLDTPGHEAFTAMRARGAKLTDIAIIIVAADDNVMPQTVEAINHASNAGVPIVFAINKIDKPTADPERIKQELAEMNYLVEDWGGKYQSQDISAKKGLNVKELLDKVLLEAEMLDLKANPNRRAVGSIIESSLDKGRGYVATVLVQNGTLKIGDILVAGIYHGRVKAMFNERGQKIETAHPGQPALILGLNGAPQAGDNFNVMETEQEAREVATKREQLQREQGLRTGKILTLAEIGRRIAVGNFRELNIIVKGDVDGSVEALSDSLIELSTEQIQVNVIHKAVGQISESDVTLASASDAIIVGFQVRPSLPARRMAEHEGVDIRLYSVIYAAIEEVKSAMEGMLSPEIKEEILGSAEVRETFKISKVGTVAGCMVKDGKIKRGCKVRLIRDGIVIYTGELDSLKRFKDDAKEVTVGFECGMSIVGYNDIKVGDYIESFEEHEVKQSL